MSASETPAPGAVSPGAAQQSQAGVALGINEFKLLQAIKGGYASDAHCTAGKCPVMTATMLDYLKPLVDRGLLSESFRDMPLKEHGKHILMGVGWVSLTDAGDAALLTATQPGDGA